MRFMMPGAAYLDENVYGRRKSARGDDHDNLLLNEQASGGAAADDYRSILFFMK